MRKEELIQKLEDIEWEDFEVKSADKEVPKNVWETVSAFSNTAGGWIIFGVVQKKLQYKIIGVANPEKIESDFLTTLRGKKFNVPISIISKKYNFDKKIVLAFYVPLSNKKPVYFNNIKNTFIRTGSGDQRATQEEIDSMYRDSAFGTRSSLAIEESNIGWLNDTSLERYRDYIKRFNPGNKYNQLSTKEFLQKLRIIVDDKITYSGLLTFGKEDFVQRIFPDFRIDLLEIPGTNYSNAEPRYTYRVTEQENIWEYYFVLFDRLQQKVDKPFKLGPEGFAIEKYPYLDALREALVNMLMHADYFSTGRSRIRVFYDRIEFFNFGALPKPLKQLMNEDVSMPRNPIIAKVFRVAKLAENAGFGFDKMIDGWKTYKNQSPKFYPEFDFVKVVFPLEKIGRLNGRSNGRLNGRLKKLYIIIKDNPGIQANRIAEILNVPIDTLNKQVRKLKELNLIERSGSKKTGGYFIINHKKEMLNE